jgi:penicillin-binding protein 1C
VSLYTALGNEGKVTKISTSPANEIKAREEAQALFGAAEIAQINHLLSNNTAGAGRLHGRIKRQAIAYKTGTGPGGSDAWAIGTNGNYVVGIWIGSPTGDYLSRNTGLGQAVPVMNKVFDGLPVGQLVHQAPQAAPEALVSVDKDKTELVVRFPVDSSVIEGRGAGVPIPIILENAQYPVLVLANGQESLWIPTAGAANVTLHQDGTYQFSLIDSGGKSASVKFSYR